MSAMSGTYHEGNPNPVFFVPMSAFVTVGGAVRSIAGSPIWSLLGEVDLTKPLLTLLGEVDTLLGEVDHKIHRRIKQANLKGYEPLRRQLL